MFGMGGSEIIVILIVALLFLGPDKLPEAAKSISKGIRDIKKQSRVLQRTIEDDEHIGGAIRDLRSALRGEDEPIRPPKPRKQLDASAPDAAAEVTAAEPAAPQPYPVQADPVTGEAYSATHNGAAPPRGAGEDAEAPAPTLTMPPTAGEPDDAIPQPSASQDAELAAMVKPAPNTIAHTSHSGPHSAAEPSPSESKHG